MGLARRAYQAFLDDLASRGCAAMGYRLTGPDPLPRLCVKHLHAQDRVVVAFPTADEAWLLPVWSHRRTPTPLRLIFAVAEATSWTAVGVAYGISKQAARERSLAPPGH